MNLNDKLDKKLLSTTEERIKLLNEIEIYSIKDFVEYFPRDYEDTSVVSELHQLKSDTNNLLIGKFLPLKKVPSKKMIVYKAFFEEKNTKKKIECIWFNNKFIKTTLPIGVELKISAKAKLQFGKVVLFAPKFERFDNSIDLGRITPIYKEHSDLNSSWIRGKMFNILENLKYEKGILNDDTLEKNNLYDYTTAIKKIHFPDSFEDLELAKKSYSFAKIFALHKRSLERKKSIKDKSKNNISIKIDYNIIKKFLNGLKFSLTNSQKIAVFEILKDLEKNQSMNRVLEGDVGSGKTLVAISSMLPVIKNNLQVAFLAPTEILAKQHFSSISNFLNNFDENIKIELLTGSTKKKKVVNDKIKNGEIHVLVGTHAIIEDTVEFKNLGFVIIDEQHRFGVQQRESLIKKGTPHTLQMTATPIPRSLAIIAFGDSDLSVLLELPPNRKKIITKVIDNDKKYLQMSRFVENQIQEGRQAFVICPLIETSEKLEVKSIEEEYHRLQNEVFPNLKIGFIHGKIKSNEKDEIMNNFKNKKFDILVATSVIEVGIDIPNANIIIIEGAERFGLSQLHQLRGRVGRGKFQSYCFLIPTNNKNERLTAMENNHCGFKLSEIDLNIRGYGDIFGIRQSGMMDIKMVNICDHEMIYKAKEEAEKNFNSQ